MKKYILLFLLFYSLKSFAQNQNSVWVFGDSAGIDFSNITNPVSFQSGMRGRGSCVSVSDSVGNLNAYAFTVENTNFISTHIYNSSHNSIPGADSITGLAWYSELVLLPLVGSNNLYYLFSIGTYGTPNPGLYYTSFDTDINGGQGGVLQGKPSIR